MEATEAGKFLDNYINDFNCHLEDELMIDARGRGWEPISHSLSFLGNLSILSIFLRKSCK